MLRRCLESRNPCFGMIMPPRVVGSPGNDYGTMLEIRSVQMLPDGRSVVETWGTHRFRILERGTLDGYMVGRIERCVNRKTKNFSCRDEASQYGFGVGSTTCRGTWKTRVTRTSRPPSLRVYFRVRRSRRTRSWWRSARRSSSSSGTARRRGSCSGCTTRMGPCRRTTIVSAFGWRWCVVRLLISSLCLLTVFLTFHAAVLSMGLCETFPNRSFEPGCLLSGVSSFALREYDWPAHR